MPDNYFGPPLPYLGGFGIEGGKAPVPPMQRGKPQPPAGGGQGQTWTTPAEMFDRLRDGFLGTLGDIASIVTGQPYGKGAIAERAKRTGETPLDALPGANKEQYGKLGEDIAKKAGLSPQDWQQFVRQTATDLGVFGGLFVLALLGLVFLVSASGGGAPQTIIREKVAKAIK